VIHPVAGGLAFLTIATFWLSTIVVELFGSRASVVALKTTIPWGFLLLVPALALTAVTGTALAKGQRRGLVGAKAKRMPFITANGLLVVLPCALFLAFKAHAGQIDRAFYTVQACELLAGATNLVLLGLSMRDGLAATAWKRASFLRAAPTRSMRVLGTREIAKDTLALRLEKPSGFAYRAGQAVYVTLNEPTSDEKGRVRTFSLASAPHEGELLVAMRTGDSTFKRALKGLGDGAKVEVEGPYGALCRVDAARPAVFLAGGIGITPFRSMILDALERGLQHRLVLFYSSRAPERAAFLAELTEPSRARRSRDTWASLLLPSTTSRVRPGWSVRW
jgi:NAD(P)H-flavin reductase